VILTGASYARGVFWDSDVPGAEGAWIARLWDSGDKKYKFSALMVATPWDDKDAYTVAFDHALEWFPRAERVEDLTR
jgi:hypothetical protein